MRKRRAPDRERARLTGLGWMIVGLGAMVAMAALNTGANLLFAVLALLLATVLHAWLCGRGSLRRVQVSIVLPRLVEARSPVRGRLEIEGARPATLLVRTQQPWFGALGVLVEGDGSALIGVPFQGDAPARGVVREIELTLITRAPYHMLERERRVSIPADVHIHPRLLPVRAPVPAPVPAAGADTSEAGEGGSLRDLRAYEAGNNPRHIHWRSSARRGELLVRRFHAEVRPELLLLVDTRGATGAAFEQLLERAASELRDALASGWSVELRLPGESVRAESARDIARGLRALSRAGPAPALVPLGAGWDRIARGALARISRIGAIGAEPAGLSPATGGVATELAPGIRP